MNSHQRRVRRRKCERTLRRINEIWRRIYSAKIAMLIPERPLTAGTLESPA